MNPTPLRRLVGAATTAALGVLLLGACSDDTGSSADTTTTTTSAPGIGEPLVDDVSVQLAGSVDQTFTGGVCTIGPGGFLQIVAGYSTGLGPPRPQGAPWANGTMQMIITGEEGEQENVIVNLVRESDSEFILAETGTAMVGEGLTTGTFEAETVTGSWTCPQVLSADEYEELTERLAG